MEYAVENRDALNIRVINLSIATAVYESYDTDPLTVAAQHAVHAGIVVVAAAGNNGASPEGITRYGGDHGAGQRSVGADRGRLDPHGHDRSRRRQRWRAFSSRGPAAIDTAAKPDLVAPGVGIESLAAPGSALYRCGTPIPVEWHRPYQYPSRI